MGPPSDPGPARDAELPDPLDRRRAYLAGPPADRPGRAPGRLRHRPRPAPGRRDACPAIRELEGVRGPDARHPGRLAAPVARRWSDLDRRRPRRAPPGQLHLLLGPAPRNAPCRRAPGQHVLDARPGRGTRHRCPHRLGHARRPDLDRPGRHRATRPALPADLARGRPAPRRVFASPRSARDPGCHQRGLRPDLGPEPGGRAWRFGHPRGALLPTGEVLVVFYGGSGATRSGRWARLQV